MPRRRVDISQEDLNSKRVNLSHFLVEEAFHILKHTHKYKLIWSIRAFILKENKLGVFPEKIILAFSKN